MSNTITVSNDGNNITIAAAGPQGPSDLAWGGITGTLSDQIDLQAELDFIADGPIKVDTLANLSQYLNGSVYELPAGDYLFRKPINWGNESVDFITTNGIYTISGANFTQHTYTGTTPWLTTTTTGVSLIISDIFITTATATAISLSNGNSLIMRISVFISCKKAVDLDSMGFLTGDAVPMVGCENGMTLNDVQSINMAFPQWNSGPDLGGIALDVSGAASERLIISQLDSRPTATESFFNFAANYSGDVDILGGIHTNGGSNFFAVGSRNQTDAKILVTGVKNVTDSKYIGNIIVNENTTATAIITQNVWVDVNFGANAVESSNIERWSLDNSTTGAESYTGNEAYSGSISGTFSILSPGSQNYELRYLIDRGAGFITLPDAVVVQFATDSASGTFPINIPLDCVNGNVIKMQVRNIDGSDNITITHLSAGPENQ